MQATATYENILPSTEVQESCCAISNNAAGMPSNCSTLMSSMYLALIGMRKSPTVATFPFRTNYLFTIYLLQ